MLWCGVNYDQAQDPSHTRILAEKTLYYTEYKYMQSYRFQWSLILTIMHTVLHCIFWMYLFTDVDENQANIVEDGIRFVKYLVMHKSTCLFCIKPSRSGRRYILIIHNRVISVRYCCTALASAYLQTTSEMKVQSFTVKIVMI